MDDKSRVAGSKPLRGAAIARIREAVSFLRAIFVTCPGPSAPVIFNSSGLLRIRPTLIAVGNNSPSSNIIAAIIEIGALILTSCERVVSPCWNSSVCSSSSPQSSSSMLWNTSPISIGITIRLTL